MSGGDEYHGRTDQVIQRHGGRPPCCRVCGEEKTPSDDHGRFGCMNFNCPTNAGKGLGDILTSFHDHSDDDPWHD